MRFRIVSGHFDNRIVFPEHGGIPNKIITRFFTAEKVRIVIMQPARSRSRNVVNTRHHARFIHYARRFKTIISTILLSRRRHPPGKRKVRPVIAALVGDAHAGLIIRLQSCIARQNPIHAPRAHDHRYRFQSVPRNYPAPFLPRSECSHS